MALLRNRDVLFAARGLKCGLDLLIVASCTASCALFCSLRAADSKWERRGVAVEVNVKASSAKAT